jgi:hypothetical protein
MEMDQKINLQRVQRRISTIQPQDESKPGSNSRFQHMLISLFSRDCVVSRLRLKYMISSLKKTKPSSQLLSDAVREKGDGNAI